MAMRPVLWLWLALAGSAGTLARFGLATAVQRAAGPRFPWGTVSVNLIGCFVFGLIFTMFERGRLSADVRTVVLAGFLGAFTTFSSFVADTAQLRPGWALANVALQNVLGLCCFWAGAALVRA